MKVKIACDVDDILFEFYLALAEWHNRAYGGPCLSKESFVSYLVHEVWGGGVDQSIRKMWEFYSSDSFRYLPLVSGAPDAIERLAEVFDLHAITGRPHALASLTDRMIETYFHGLFCSVHHVDSFSIGGGVSRPKVEVCREVGASIVIEDYPGHAIPCAEAGMRVILFDQPWNRNIVVSSGCIERVRSWGEALRLLL
jgi:uncharacterized HAD superfamily protein